MTAQFFDHHYTVRCGRFLYDLSIIASARLPVFATPAAEFLELNAAVAPATLPAAIDAGFPLALIHRPENAADPANDETASADAAQAGEIRPEQPAKDRVRLALVWIAPDPRNPAVAMQTNPAAIVARIQTMLAQKTAVSPAIEGLGELATANHLQIQASVIELAAGGVGEAGGLDDDTLERILPKRFHAALAEERAREATLAYIQVCTAGLPPLVHVHSQGIIFPIRSWVPAGLYPEWQPLCQSIECEIGDRLVIHTELTARAEALKQFHRSLQSGAIDWSLFHEQGDGPGASTAALVLTVTGPSGEAA